MLFQITSVLGPYPFACTYWWECKWVPLFQTQSGNIYQRALKMLMYFDLVIPFTKTTLRKKWNVEKMYKDIYHIKWKIFNRERT